MGCVSSRKDWSEEDSSGRKLRVGQSLLLPHSYPCCLKGSIGGVQCAATIHRWQCKIIYSELICAKIYCWHTLRMVASRAMLPDLDALDPNELKALIISQHELIVSRDSEIEQLKMLIAKLRRMQFGRSSEKLDRQIETLELRLEALDLNHCEQGAAHPDAHKNEKPQARPARR